MPAKRPVVDSDGGEYSSVGEAAGAAWVAVGTMHAALQATRRGRYYTLDGLQWAYASEVPEVWPSEVDQREVLDCPMKFCGFCPHRDQNHDQKKD